MKSETAPNILKVFKRNGKMLYLYDLRAAIFPLSITVIAGIISSLIIVLLPELIKVGFMVGMGVFSVQHIEFMEIIDDFHNYIINYQDVIIIMMLLGPVLAGIRKICISNNWAVVKHVSPDIDFRIGIEEVLSAIVITVSFLFLSENARFFSIFTFFGALFLFAIWQYFHDSVLELYVAITQNHSPQLLFGIWSYIVDNDFVKLSAIKKIGYKSKAKTVFIEGDISQESAKNLREILPEEIDEINQVIINSPADRMKNRFYKRIIHKLK